MDDVRTDRRDGDEKGMTIVLSIVAEGQLVKTITSWFDVHIFAGVKMRRVSGQDKWHHPRFGQTIGPIVSPSRLIIHCVNRRHLTAVGARDIIETRNGRVRNIISRGRATDCNSAVYALFQF